ncbi:MAG: chorismate mutase [Clostridia bacterium]|nr:chorismate mutase [Clostridia bacterium]
MDLQEIRARIDELDTQLVELLCRRMTVAKDVADYKRANGMAVLDRQRELAVLDKRAAQAGEAFGPYIREIYEKIMEMSRAYQEELLR